MCARTARAPPSAVADAVRLASLRLLCPYQALLWWMFRVRGRPYVLDAYLQLCSGRVPCMIFRDSGAGATAKPRRKSSTEPKKDLPVSRKHPCTVLCSDLCREPPHVCQIGNGPARYCYLRCHVLCGFVFPRFIRTGKQTGCHVGMLSGFAKRENWLYALSCYSPSRSLRVVAKACLSWPALDRERERAQ